MIDFEGYYLVPPDQVAYIETRRGGGDAQYGLFLGLSGGKELGVRLIEACINKTDKRTLRIWKQLQQLLHLESEETE